MYYDKRTIEDFDKKALEVLNEKKGSAKVSITPTKHQEYKQILSMMNVDSALWIDEEDEEQLFRMIAREEMNLENIGISVSTIKAIYNTKPNTKARRKALQKLIEELTKRA